MGAIENAGNILSMAHYNLRVSEKLEQDVLTESNAVSREFLINLPARIQNYPVLTLKPATQDMVLTFAASLYQNKDLGFALSPRKKQHQHHWIDRGVKKTPYMYPQINLKVDWHDNSGTVLWVEEFIATSMVLVHKKPLPVFFKLTNNFPEDPTRQHGAAAMMLLPDDELYQGKESLARVISQMSPDWNANRDGSQLRRQRPTDASDLFYSIGEITMRDRLIHVWFSDISKSSTKGNDPQHVPTDRATEPDLSVMHT